MRVLFAVDVPPEFQTYLRERIAIGVELVFVEDSRDEQQLLAAAPGAEVVVGMRHLEAILEATDSVRLVQVPWAGADAPARTLRRREGILLANLHANAHATAQYGVTMLLALLNHLVPAHGLMVEGRWNDRRELPPPRLIRGRRVVIVGAGSIGNEAGWLLNAFGCDVTGVRRRASEGAPPFDAIVGVDDLHDVAARADVLFVTLPGTQETWHMIDHSVLAALGPDGFLVNVGRGEVVDPKALFEALKRRRIAGAAMDVWFDYHPESDERDRAFPYEEPFHELDNVILSPHRAGNSEPDPSDWDDVIENINRVAVGRRDLLNLVDLERGY